MEDNLEGIIETIKDNITNQKCVLVLGPDLYIKEIDNQSWERKEYFRKLETELNHTIYFPNDEVFSSPNRFGLMQKVKEFYQNGGDIPLMELISSIKFPLIINASPDESLRLFLQKIDKSVQFDYFEGEKDENKELKFDINNSLIYNVFGKASDPQSLVITHGSLYDKIQQILPKNSFPKQIRSFLDSAGSFIFLGFKFESWSYQLLSYKILNSNSNIIDPNKIRLSSSHFDNNNNINIIMSSAMGMNLINQPASQLLKTLYELIREANMPDLIRPIDRQEKFTSFLSYSRSVDQNIPNIESIVNKLIQSLRDNSSPTADLKLIYDKKDLQYGQSIDSFMTRIGKGKTVVLIVGNKYLESAYCMIEALRVYQFDNIDKRIFIILIENEIKVDFKNIGDGIEKYQNYWKSQLVQFANNNSPNKSDIINFLDILDFIPNFLEKIKASNFLKINLNDLENIDFVGHPLNLEWTKFVQQLITKMKED
jgi:hypothetical protein